MSTWAEVDKTFYIEDLTGKPWLVDGIGKVKVRLVDADGNVKTIDRPDGDRPVTIRYIPPEYHAIQLLRSTLGATILKEDHTHAAHH